VVQPGELLSLSICSKAHKNTRSCIIIYENTIPYIIKYYTKITLVSSIISFVAAILLFGAGPIVSTHQAWALGS
jgi:hypothetical protein